MTTACNPCRLRARHTGQRPRIDRTQRTIHDVAVCCRGEATGHDLWIDHEFLDQVARAINADGEVETRRTHYGQPVGHVTAARLDAGTVRADLHLDSDDQADYLLRLAIDDPAAFGLSVAFRRDTGAEELFASEHTDPETGDFRSPDPANVEHLHHIRLHALYAVDVVDEPAANPAGLFHVPRETELDGILRYAVGLTNAAPADNPLGIHPDRLREFLTRFLTNHGLAIRPKPQGRAKATPTPAVEREHRMAPLLRRLRAANADLQRRLAAHELGVRPPSLNPCRLRTGRA